MYTGTWLNYYILLYIYILLYYYYIIYFIIFTRNWEHETQGKRKKPVGEENRRTRNAKKTWGPAKPGEQGIRRNQHRKTMNTRDAKKTWGQAKPGEPG